MNLLCFVILILAILEYVIASEFSETEIDQGIDDRNMEEVERRCGQDKSLWEQASDYVVDREDVDLIANFLKTGMLVTGYTFLIVCKRDDMISRVVRKMGISCDEFVVMSAQADAMLSGEKLMNPLKRVPTVQSV